jgi:hypothetical protein
MNTKTIFIIIALLAICCFITGSVTAVGIFLYQSTSDSDSEITQERNEDSIEEDDDISSQEDPTSIPEPTNTTIPTRIPRERVYDDANVSFEYPSNWEIDNSIDPNADVAFTFDGDNFVSITYVGIPERITLNPQVCQNYRQNLIDSFTSGDLVIENQSTFTVDFTRLESGDQACVTDNLRVDYGNGIALDHIAYIVVDTSSYKRISVFASYERFSSRNEIIDTIESELNVK